MWTSLVYLFLFLPSNVLCSRHRRHKQKITIALNLPFDVPTPALIKLGGDDMNTGKYYASAAKVAVQDINRNTNLLGNIKLNLYYNHAYSDTKCLDFRPSQAMLHELNVVNASGFIGFGCYCLTVAKVLASINLPLISH
uniref:Receptor ligand binding region domain-containing protein n=1 Tax=Clytia hemisphaerica TaxID=252671 RepID=A0A7M5WJ60_9CNID